MRPDDLVRIQHMIDAAKEAVAYAQGQTMTMLQEDNMRTLAVTRLLEIIGEAAATMSQEAKDAYPHIPWRVMAAMRNRLIHAYFNVDLKIVLDTTQMNLPSLIIDLEALVHNETNM